MSSLLEHKKLIFNVCQVYVIIYVETAWLSDFMNLSVFYSAQETNDIFYSLKA